MRRAALLLVLVGACSSRGASTSATEAIAQADFPAAYAHAICDGYGNCCKIAGRKLDVDACVAKVRESIAATADALLSEGRKFDPEAAARCVAVVKAVVPACYTSSKQEARVASACLAAFTLDAHAAPGEPCSFDNDCAPSADGEVRCVGTTAFVDGGVVSSSICQVLAKPYAGVPCEYTFNGSAAPVVGKCSYGEDPQFTCDPQTNTCVQRRPVGSSCFRGSDQCVGDAFCSPNGVCVSRLRAGDPCLPDAINECGTLLFCEGVSAVCIAKRPDGAACSDNVECAGGHCTSGVCNQSTQTHDPFYLCAPH